MTRSINAEGLSHIKKFEGLRPEPIEMSRTASILRLRDQKPRSAGDQRRGG
ncbi:hypothetical protein [Rhizobium yanglingense]